MNTAISTWAVVTILATQFGQTPPAEPPSSRPAPPDEQSLAHVKIDRERRTIDLDAQVILREGGWLELLACSPGTRTHESLLVVHAKPSHVHLALVMLGLEPGTPMRWRQVGDQYQVEPATGPTVAVTIVTTDRAGAEVETPASQWVISRQTDQALPDNTWLFTGSSFDDTTDPPTYRGDVEGSVLSLVQFGDEVLARPTQTTNQTDQGMLIPNTQAIPPVGTNVVIRLRPTENR